MLLFVPRASDETLICGPGLLSLLEEFLERTRQEFLSDPMMRSLSISCFSQVSWLGLKQHQNGGGGVNIVALMDTQVTAQEEFEDTLHCL